MIKYIMKFFDGSGAMIIFSDMNFTLTEPCVLALGCFDGVHIGHRAVISKARAIADTEGLSLAIFTFEQPPRNFFAPNSVPVISTTEDKLDILSSLGVDTAICLPFDKNILSMPAESFIDEIVFGKLDARHVVCGYNYSFGKGAVGTPSLIEQKCKQTGRALTVVAEQRYGDVSVSSSLIRRLIGEGDVHTANKYLCRPYSISSVVVDGQHLARTLGFPTVNTIPQKGLLLPKSGVYVTRVSFCGTHRYGITNVGIRPTVGTNILCAETHIFDFEGNLYGKSVKVEFLHFLRSETQFDSVQAMAAQIHKDIDRARAYVEKLVISHSPLP